MRELFGLYETCIEPTEAAMTEEDLSLAVVPFAYTSPFADTVRLSERQVEVCGQVLRMRQRYESDGRGGTGLGFGASVYNASIALSLWLEAHPEVVRDRSVVELGCGPGLVSIAASLVGARAVLCTDGDPASVDLARLNCESNLPRNSCPVSCARLLWGDSEDIEAALSSPLFSNSRGNLVLASDVVAPPYKDSYDSLVATMLRLCNGPGGGVLVAYQRRHHSDEVFWRRFKAAFTVETVPREDLHIDFFDSQISIIRGTPIYES